MTISENRSDPRNYLVTSKEQKPGEFGPVSYM